MNAANMSGTNLRSRYFRLIIGFFAVIVVAGASFFIYIKNEQTRLSEDMKSLENKVTSINQLAATVNDMLFRVRGYAAFTNPNELKLLDESFAKLDIAMDTYFKLELTDEEMKFGNDLKTFYVNYKSKTVPQIIRLADAGNHEALSALSQDGITESVNNFMSYTKDFILRSDLSLNQMAEDSINQANNSTIIAYAFITAILLFLTLMIWRILENLINPILRLEGATHSLVAGKEILLGNLDRKDEIGRLYDAFLNMARSIQDKEEELTAQNEELQAQQDELHDQQTRLKRSLSEIESMMKALDQSSAIGILTHKGVFTYANDNLSEYTHFKNSEILGNTFKLFEFYNITDEQMEQTFRKLSSGAVWSNEVQIQAKSGTAIWLHLTIVPYLNDEGEVYQYILIANDINSLKNVQQELAETLRNTEQTKLMLELNNQLNHDMTYTLDKQEFADKFIHFMNRQYSFDSSFFLLIKDRVSARMGIPQERVDRYVEDNNKDMLYRLQSERSYQVKRLATQAEQGISSEQVHCYDYYTSVMNSENEILAVFCGSRIGSPFGKEEINEIEGIFNRVALAIERLFMFEEIESGRKLNRDIVNNVNEGIQLVNTDGSMLHINKVLCGILNYDSWTEGSTIPADQWLNPLTEASNESEQLRSFYQKVMSKDTVDSSTIQYSVGTDSKKYIDVYAIPVYRRDVRTGSLFVHRDITREHELDVMKSELVSTVSHELRTPLSSVLGFTELLLSKTMKPEKQLKYLETIHKEAKRLTDLINDFLDLQRMESGKQQYDMQRVNLSEVVMEVIDQYKLSTSHQFLIVDEAHIAEVEVDRAKIIQVLTNLLSNATKFSPDNNEIKVILHNEPERIVVSIQDKGLGIPKDQIGQLFQKFRRVDNSASKRIGGTGLGLAICKEIIEKQNGTIGMDSVEGEGTTAWFSIPILHAEASRHEELNKWSTDKENKPNVMIVEDDYSLSLLLSEELKGKGFRVTHHYHPEQAFDQALKTPFMAIVVDLMLGEELDGWDLIRMLKNDPRTDTIPIVISSALDKSDKNLMNNVIQKYLTKPYPPGDLSSTIDEIVKIKQGIGEVLFPDYNQAL
jgi:PAS domain S-box-containing protein